MKQLLTWLKRHYVLGGILIRFAAAFILPWLLDSGVWIPGVAYTDIDYHVYRDASLLIMNGESPYQRHTYRYTPFLALLTSTKLTYEYARYIFCCADAICGWMICKLKCSQQQRRRQNQLSNSDVNWTDLLWWMYNPLAIYTCTRGSAESLIVLMPVLVTLALVKQQELGATTSNTRAMVAGIVHGISIHCKLYPIIYTLAYMAYLGKMQQQQGNYNLSRNKSKWTCLVVAWIRRLCQPCSLLFFTTSLLTAAACMYVAISKFGPQALEEGFLYHLGRMDHRHNYSMFWYPIYLCMGMDIPLPGALLLIPQVVLLVVSSLGMAPHALELCLFCQTYLFVTFNKVITAQYFTWYLCLLPLAVVYLDINPRQMTRALAWLGVSIALWLASAYALEMKGMAVHRQVWMASVFYFCTNIYLFRTILQMYKPLETKKKD